MATQTQTAPSPPHLKIVDRFCSIPLLASYFDTLNATLSSNAYTRSPYCAAKDLSFSAYKLTAPLQIRLAPLIVVADDYAIKAVDIVENRYPYPFKAQPEEVATYVRERRDSASQYVKDRRDSVVTAANQTLDERVKSPAIYVAQGIDHQLAPIVNVFEVAVTKLNGSESTPPSPDGETKYQYQRAIALSKNLKDSLYVKSNEQLKELQASNVLVQRATVTAQKITSLASSSFETAQTTAHHLSDVMLSDLKKLQSSLTTDFHDLNTSLAGIITDLKTTLTSDLPMNEKVVKIGTDVKERVSPMLETVAGRVKEVIATLARRGEEALDSAKKTSAQNGANNGHAP